MVKPLFENSDDFLLGSLAVIHDQNDLFDPIYSYQIDFHATNIDIINYKYRINFHAQNP